MGFRKHTHICFANILASENVCNIPQSNKLVVVAIQFETCDWIWLRCLKSNQINCRNEHWKHKPSEYIVSVQTIGLV